MQDYCLVIIPVKDLFMIIKRNQISVGCVISMTVVYLFASKSSSSSSSSASSLNRRDSNLDASDGSVDWKHINLLSKELPTNLEDIIEDVTIEQSRHDIYGADTFVQVD